MQQTDKYKLNLIETSDTFSPAPLNENMERVEAQLQAVRAEASAEAQARAAGDAAEAQARTAAVNSEAQARITAVNSEAQARAEAVAAEAQARAAADSALDARIQILEIHKYVIGYATDDSTTEYLGSTPIAVLVINGGYDFALENRPGQYIKIVDGGFYHNSYFAACSYIAFF